MSRTPLNQLPARWWDHAAALWWLGLLYRKPDAFKAALGTMGRWRQLCITLLLYLHAFPYMVAIVLAGHMAAGLLGIARAGHGEMTVEFVAVDWLAFWKGIGRGIAIGIVGGIVGGIADGIAIGIAIGIAGGIAGGIAIGIADGIAGGIAIGIAVGIAIGIAIGIADGIAGGIANGIGFGIGFGIAGGIAFGIANGITIGIVFWIVRSRSYYLPLHLVLVWPRPRPLLYPWHPIAWDDLVSIPLPRFDRLLVACAEQSPLSGQAEIERLISGYPAQRPAALRARTILTARNSARQGDLAKIADTLASLPEGTKGYLRQTNDLRAQIGALAARQMRLDGVRRPVLREPLAAALRAEIEAFRSRVAGFDEPLATEFQAAAIAWLAIADQQWQGMRAITDKNSAPQIFRAGDPVDRSQEAFVPRDAVVGDLEQQLTLGTGCPGLVLYGRRRTGKSTVLRNVADFLPPEVSLAALSMQDARAFSSLDGLIGVIAEAVRSACPDLPPGETPADLPALTTFLGTADRHLATANRRLILAIDEYEYLDEKIGEGVFPVDLLYAVRESIQTHRRLIWLFAGSHAITELTHADWPSYLISARTLVVGMFSPAETRLLLTEPLHHSTLWAKDDPTRPRFDPALWGDGGIDWIHAQAGGWPHLVQLLAESAIDTLNESDRRALDAALLETAADRAVVRGGNVFHQLLERECTQPGEWDYLSRFRTQGTQPPPNDDAVARSLKRRLLVCEEGNVWRLRVPLMARWLRNEI